MISLVYSRDDHFCIIIMRFFCTENNAWKNYFMMKYDPGFCSQDSPAGGTSDKHI